MKKYLVFIAGICLAISVRSQQKTQQRGELPNEKYSRFSIGLQGGTPFHLSDVDMDVLNPAYGGFIKMSVSHLFSFRAQYMTGLLTGSPKDHEQYNARAWFQNNVSVVSLQTILNLGTINLHKNLPKASFYLGAGYGVVFNDGFRDRGDSNGYVRRYAGWSFCLPVCIGFRQKLSGNLDLGVEAIIYGTNDDLIDLFNPATSHWPDAFGFGTINLTYNITSAKRPEHIDWVNPVDKLY